MNFRSRALLDLAYSFGQCTLRIPGVCTGGSCEPAHSNQSRHGKGKSLKAADCFFAASCRACHQAIDQGSKLSREDRIAYWTAGFERTLLEVWMRGFVRVDGSKVRLGDRYEMISPAIQRYTAGEVFSFRAQAENTDPAVTISVNGGRSKRAKSSKCVRSAKTVPRTKGWQA